MTYNLTAGTKLTTKKHIPLGHLLTTLISAPRTKTLAP